MDEGVWCGRTWVACTEFSTWLSWAETDSFVYDLPNMLLEEHSKLATTADTEWCFTSRHLLSWPESQCPPWQWPALGNITCAIYKKHQYAIRSWSKFTFSISEGCSNKHEKGYVTMLRDLLQRFAVPHRRAPSSHFHCPLTQHSHAGSVCARLRPPFVSGSLEVGAVLLRGRNNSNCAACSCLSLLSVGDPLGSTEATKTAAAKWWRTEQPASCLCSANPVETAVVVGCSQDP